MGNTLLGLSGPRVCPLAAIEKQLGIHDLAQFTPKTP
jgi:hypothetical protein